MSKYRAKKGETYGETIARVVEAEYRKGTKLPDVRRILASSLGGPEDGTSYLGTADPAYYRLVGLDAPLLDGKGNVLLGTPDAPIPSAALARAIARRRRLGVRWNVLRASVLASTGTYPTDAEVKRLAAKGGVDLDASYTGRGTRAGATTTRVAPEARLDA